MLGFCGFYRVRFNAFVGVVVEELVVVAPILFRALGNALVEVDVARFPRLRLRKRFAVEIPVAPARPVRPMRCT